MWMSRLCLLAVSIVVGLAAPPDYSSGLGRRAVNGKAWGQSPFDPRWNGSPRKGPPYPFVSGENAPDNLIEAQKNANLCVDKCWNIYVGGPPFPQAKGFSSIIERDFTG